MENKQQKNIHWFPGHMKKASNEIAEKIKLVDIVIEVLDARVPFSSRNHALDSIIKSKPRLILLNKQDLAIEQNNQICNSLKINENDEVLYTNLTSHASYKFIERTIKKMSDKRNEKYLSKGMKPQLLRAMVIGIPNVGKSSFINYLNKKNSAPVGNTPGFTKAQKLVKVRDLFYLLDTPGVLPPSYDERSVVEKLAILGAIKTDILPIDEIIDLVIKILKSKYKNEFNLKYDINVSEDMLTEEIIELIANKRGFVLKGQSPDLERTKMMLINDFKNGKICKVYLD